MPRPGVKGALNLLHSLQTVIRVTRGCCALHICIGEWQSSIADD
jgi:hypothetical protein